MYTLDCKEDSLLLPLYGSERRFVFLALCIVGVSLGGPLSIDISLISSCIKVNTRSRTEDTKSEDL